jgi:hypothetical protein
MKHIHEHAAEGEHDHDGSHDGHDHHHVHNTFDKEPSNNVERALVDCLTT